MRTPMCGYGFFCPFRCTKLGAPRERTKRLFGGRTSIKSNMYVLMGFTKSDDLDAVLAKTPSWSGRLKMLWVGMPKTLGTT